MVHALLLDGPVELVNEVELSDAAPPPRLTVDFGGWHQHFERTAAIQTKKNRVLRVYRWSYRTAIAE